MVINNFSEAHKKQFEIGCPVIPAAVLKWGIIEGKSHLIKIR